MSNTEETKKIQLPPPLKPGDLLRVVAPSGTLREFERFEQGVEIWLSRGYQVELGNNCYDRWGYLAGDDAQRRQALTEAWQDPDCKAILCARGGYGATRLIEDWTWEGKLSSQPKWLIGFSDVTALLWSLGKMGVGGVHGSLLTTLSQEPKWCVDRLFDCVEGRSLDSLKGVGWGCGKAKGLIVPANLTVATCLLATPLQLSLQGTILALEDVSEAPYRLDRMLTQWRMSGAFQGVKGIALGRFSNCNPPAGIPSLTIDEVLRDRLGDLGIPVVSDLPFGHDGANAALPMGQVVELDGDEGVLRF